jgi:CelD/BcsL family acetyltransferase involved in cellulose biosynthesis
MSVRQTAAELLTLDAPAWRAVLRETRHDVYHLPEYLSFAARRQEAGAPIAFLAEDGGRRLFVPLIVRPVPADIGGGERLRDATSPHGYPGPLLAPGPSDDPIAGDEAAAWLDVAIEALRWRLREEGIVAAFVRLHPLLPLPLEVLRRHGTVVEHPPSVSIDLSLTAEEHWRETRELHRRDIRKALRAGYMVRMDERWERLDAFADAYAQSMARLGASAQWRLSREHFADLCASLGERAHLCVVELDGELAAGSVVLEEDGIVEYHLAGTADAHLRASPSKLIVHFAREWARERGARVFHLAGSARRGDSLNHFKRGFSPLEHPVHTWRLVTDDAAYAALLARWSEATALRPDSSGAYFPAYRKPVGAHDRTDGS